MAGARSGPSRTGRFQAWYVDHSGKRVFFTGTRDRKETIRAAARLEDHARLIRQGALPVPRSAAKHQGRSFAEVADEYLAWGKSQGGRHGFAWGRKHAIERGAKLRFWCERLGLETLADLDGILPRVEGVLRELQAGGRAGKTLQNYLETLHSFVLWCKRRGYLGADVLEGVAAFDVTPRTTRRALTPDEIRALLGAAPEHRRLLYETALLSGLRRGELQALTLAHVDTQRGALILDAAWTKNRRPGTQPLPRALIDKLLAFGESGAAKSLYARHYQRADATRYGVPDEPLFFVSRDTARDMRLDLAAAGVPAFKVGAGKADFHSLRVSYVTLIVEAGATVREAQSLARHLTPGLTMNTYARTRNDRLAELAERISETVFSGQKCATSVHRLAAGAEELDVTALEARGIRQASTGGEGGI